MITLTLTEKNWTEVIDALNTIAWKYDDNNCDKLAEDLNAQLAHQLEVK
jgi:hypothetical protein